MSRAKMVAINGEKLKAHILTTGTTLAEASEQLGYSRDYLTNCVRQNMMTRQGISLIGLMLNIPEELYVPKEAEPESIPEDQPFTTEEYLARIMRLLEEITEKMEVRNYEQKVFNLPFGDSDSSSLNDHIV